MTRWIRRAGGRLGLTIRRAKPYAPDTFWEARAEADIYTYDHPLGFTRLAEAWGRTRGTGRGKASPRR